MMNALRFSLMILLALLLFVPGCSRDETPSEPDEAEISSVDAGDEMDGTYEEEGEEDGLEAAGDFDAPAPDLPSLAKIRSVSVETITGNPRDGFKAVIRFEGAQNSDIRYIYDWTVNGSDISGEIEETLPWQEGFKRGDLIGVSVTPYSDLGQGAVTAGGAFTIPNSPPVISSEPSASYSDGRFTYTVLAEDPDGDPVDFTLRGAPPGMTIEPATGLIVWEYGEGDAGEYKVTVIAADSEGASVSQELTLTIAPGSGEE